MESILHPLLRGLKCPPSSSYAKTASGRVSITPLSKSLRDWRRGPGSNRRIKVLQTSPLPLGYRASAGKPFSFCFRSTLANRLAPGRIGAGDEI